MTPSLLLFGFLVGLKHALEADHVAAVASLASGCSSLRDHVKLAGLWGLGHAGAIVAFGGVVVAVGVAVPATVANGLECIVGLILAALGVDVLRRVRRQRIHFHVHRHDGDREHVHAHAHAGELDHDPAHHEHTHLDALSVRALAVGSLHGLAGSAALIVLSAEATRSVAQALGYLTVSGLGTIAGMVSLSVGISIPLRVSVRHFARYRQVLEGTLGALTIALGVWIAVRTGVPR